MNHTTACCTGSPDRASRGDGSYDLAVVGAGSAGFSAAITAAEQGAHVAFIGHGTIGGTCVNVGCVPSKRLIRATEALHQTGAAGRFAGVRGHGELTDWRALVAEKDELVAELRQAKYLDVLGQYDSVTYVEGAARLTEDGVWVNGRLVRARATVITTGARPAIPRIPGIETVSYLTSTTALELERLPQSMIVVGGGYIGCEIAQMLARAGVRVTIAMRSRLLPGAEPEIAEALRRYFQGENIVVRQGLEYRAIRRSDAGVTLEATAEGQPETLAAERVLVATGRKPNTEGLGLEEFGLALDERGGIRVDVRMRTSQEGVYAAGDVTGRHQFVYMAAYGAKVAAENALNGDKRRYDATGMPSVIFTDPQVASAGLTEVEARQAGYEVRTSELPLEYLPRALAAKDTRGLIKLVADARTDQLLGAHILAPEGCDSIQTAALAIRQGLTVTELGEMIFPYLTTVEGLKLAAQSFDKDVRLLSCCAG